MTFVFIPRAGYRERDQDSRRGDCGHQRPPQHRIDDRAPDPGLAAAAGAGADEGTRPFSTRSPSQASIAGSTVSEPIIATPTTIIAPRPMPANRLVAGQEHSGHRDHHGQARDQHRPPDVAAARCERGPRAALRPLLTLAPHVEQRVVHADRHPDQQDDRGRRVVDREDLARQRDQADRRRTAEKRQQQRDPGRHERAERDQQDQQRDRQRQLLGLLEVLFEDVAPAPCRRWPRRTARSAARVARWAAVDLRR